MRIILGLDAPDAGRALVNGRLYQGAAMAPPGRDRPWTLHRRATWSRSVRLDDRDGPKSERPTVPLLVPFSPHAQNP